MDELIVQGEISSHIFTLRDKQVMLDRDLAALYGVETKYLKRQVQRNIERFDENDFMMCYPNFRQVPLKITQPFDILTS